MDMRRNARAWRVWFPNIGVRTSLLAARMDGRLAEPGLCEGTYDTAVFNAWIKTRMCPRQNAHHLIIMYNAAFHDSSETAPLCCSLHPIPLTSPHRAGVRRPQETLGVSGAGHSRRHRQALSTIVALAIEFNSYVVRVVRELLDCCVSLSWWRSPFLSHRSCHNCGTHWEATSPKNTEPMAVKQPWALDAQCFGRVWVNQKGDPLSVLQFVSLVFPVNGRLLPNYGTSSIRDARPKP